MAMKGNSTKKTGSNDPFNVIDVGLTSTPTFHDIDGDGDLDLVAGENHGKLNYYLNQTEVVISFTHHQI
jgi:hypothetical protein